MKSSNILRINEWWDSKIATLFGLVYLFSIHSSADIKRVAGNFIFIVLWMIFAAALGYYINDVFDLDKDIIAHKKNHTLHHTSLQKTIIALSLIAAILMSWFFLSKSLTVLMLILAQIILFLLYSLPFTRFKEIPIPGLICDSIYASVIPCLMVFLVVNAPTGITPISIIIISWSMMAGVRNIINHHIDDHVNDTISGTITSTVVLGKTRMKNLMHKVISPIEFVLFMLFLILMNASVPYLWLIYLLYLIWVYHRELVFVKANKHNWTLEQQEGYNFVGGVVLNEFYEKWLPLLCLLFFLRTNPFLWWLLVIHIAIFWPNIRDFKKDYLILKNLILAKVFWTSVSAGYSVAGIIKAILVFIYYEILGGLYYKVYGRVKHYIFWKIYIPLSKKDE